MRKLLIYMKDYKKESVLAPLFKLLEASFELLVPLVMARIIDPGDRKRGQALCDHHVPADGEPWYYRACLLCDGTVFCGKGRGGIFHKTAARIVFPYPGTFLYGNGYHGDLHTDHQNDK